jgi:O-acetyl-ADP-ribose deacetylase
MARLTLHVGDITELAVDAIVNAANEQLRPGGGVDGAIHRAAGPGLVAECKGLGGCPTGEARITGGHKLAARHVIHTAGPVWRGGGQGEDELLAACYRNAMMLAQASDVTLIAFPAISTGVYKFPAARAARVAVETVQATLPETPDIAEVIFVAFNDAAAEPYRELLDGA